MESMHVPKTGPTARREAAFSDADGNRLRAAIPGESLLSPEARELLGAHITELFSAPPGPAGASARDGQPNGVEARADATTGQFPATRDFVEARIARLEVSLMEQRAMMDRRLDAVSAAAAAKPGKAYLFTSLLLMALLIVVGVAVAIPLTEPAMRRALAANLDFGGGEAADRVPVGAQAGVPQTGNPEPDLATLQTDLDRLIGAYMTEDSDIAAPPSLPADPFPGSGRAPE